MARTVGCTILLICAGCVVDVGSEGDVASRSEPIINGYNDTNNAIFNAAVWVGGCTGLVVAPNMVLTAGHCAKGNQPYQGVGQTPLFHHMTAVNGTLYAHDKNGASSRILSRSIAAYDLPFSYLGGGGPTNFTAMTAYAGALWGTTATNRLMRRNPVSGVWFDIGHANSVVGLVGSSGLLIAITSDGKLWWRYDIQIDSNWNWYATAPAGVTALALGPDDQLYATTTGNRLWQYDSFWAGGETWDDVGHASNIVSMDSDGDGYLYALTSDNKVWLRDAVPYDQNWRFVDYSQSSTAQIGILDGALYVVTTSGTAYSRPVFSYWTQWGTSPAFNGIGATTTTMFGVDSSNNLRARALTGGSWSIVGSVPAGAKYFNADAEANRLYLLDSSGTLYSRSAAGGSWTGSAPFLPSGVTASQVTGLAAENGRVYITDNAGNLYRRSGAAWASWGHAFNRGSLAYDASYLFSASANVPATVLDTVVMRPSSPQGTCGSLPGFCWDDLPPWEDEVNATAWYNLVNPITILVGASVGSSPPGTCTPPGCNTYTATQYSTPGETDILLLQLSSSIPGTQAVVSPIITDAAQASSPWYRNPGYGCTTALPTCTPASFRQFAWSSNLMIGSGDTADRATVTLWNGAQTSKGDSGGPLRKYLSPFATLGVLQTGGTYISTFSTSYTHTDGWVHPNVSGWLQTMVP